MLPISFCSHHSCLEIDALKSFSLHFFGVTYSLFSLPTTIENIVCGTLPLHFTHAQNPDTKTKIGKNPILEKTQNDGAKKKRRAHKIDKTIAIHRKYVYKEHWVQRLHTKILSLHLILDTYRFHFDRAFYVRFAVRVSGHSIFSIWNFFIFLLFLFCWCLCPIVFHLFSHFFCLLSAFIQP